MPENTVFISHTSRDDDFVVVLRQALELHHQSVWADSRSLAAGDILDPKIEQAIEDSSAFILVISVNALTNPRWVRKETQKALAIQAERGADSYRIIPLLCDGLTNAVLEHFFSEEPVAIHVSTSDIQAALPQIHSALGLRLPDDATPAITPDETKYNDLTLVLEAPELYTEGGVRRGRARAHFVMEPADGSEKITTEPFDFTSPLGPIEAGRMKWYIEDYPQAPFLEKILDRGAALEKEMAEWGQALFQKLTEVPDARELVWEWKGEPVHERRFSVQFNFFNDKNLPAEKLEAVNLLIATPWEILHDGRGYLFQGKKPVRVRRRIPNRSKKAKLELQDKLRVLLLSPRPEDERASYIDHRVAPAALMAALEPLGDRAELQLLETPTFSAMCAAIRDAERAGKPFSVVHFDGHGVFDPHRGLGALCFESTESSEQDKLEDRKTDIVYADQLLAELRGFRIPFFFLDACQSAMAEKDPTASVAATLLETGAASVAAMSYSVLVSTAEAFAKAFYMALAQGERIGSAMLAGQRALHADPVRAELPRGEKLRLQDWFVPVLFQEQTDPRLVKVIPGAQSRKISAEQRAARAGDTPDKPHGGHHFVGRKRELLALERLLLRERWAALLGAGGAGKTTLAAELARWMLRTGRFERLAFVSFEGVRDVRTALLALGTQLLGKDFVSRVADDEDKAFQEIARRLAEYRTLIILDNLESIQPNPNGEPLPGVESFDKFLAFFGRLLKSDERTRLLLTTREPLPAPFDRGRNTRRIGQLAPADALRLIAEVMRTAGIEVPSLNVEDLDEQFGALARTANYHARALTLLTQSLAGMGEASRENLLAFNANYSHLMAELERKKPGERENSLFASVALSLQRLPEEMRAVVNALAVFQGGADLVGWAEVALCDHQTAAQTGMALVQVGLAEVALDEFPYYFKIDPALPAWLAANTRAEQLETQKQRWVEGMMALSGFLYQQRTQNSALAHNLALLSEANLVAMLAELEKTVGPERIVDIADTVESLFSRLSRPQVVHFAQTIRERAAAQLAAGGGWSHAQYLSQSAAVDRFWEQGNLPAAFQLARAILEQCEQAGSQAYPGAEYDGAMANWRLGRVLKRAGQAEQALPFLQRARQRFLNLSEAGNADAGSMASACLTEIGDCFAALGQYDQAAAQYQQAVELSEKLGDLRQGAVGKGQLASTRMYQKNYAEALRLYEEAKTFFERNQEAASVATIWHQIGIMHQESKNYPAAETAYQRALEIRIREKIRQDEAASLTQLGSLYKATGRLEDAVRMYERAAELYVALKDIRYEGVVRNNLADTLIKRRSPAEARIQLLRAIECKAQFGHVAEPWTTWAILYDLETAEGNTAAAFEARQKAMQAYAAYRRDGGESQSSRFRLVAAVVKAIQSGEEQVLIPQLEEMLQEDRPVFVKALIHTLLALLRGEGSPALADDLALNYMDAVDLRLLFEG